MRFHTRDSECRRAVRRRGTVAAAGALAVALAGLPSAPALAQQTAGGTPSTSARDAAPSDAAITRAVERELLRDRAVPFDDLNVSTASGITTLSGVVDNLLARDRAVHVAQAVRGVRGVVDRITVEPEARSDEEIRQSVVNSLVMNAATESYEVDVEVDDGTVTLTGTVDSWPERELAGRMARGVVGVREVKNDVTFDIATDRSDAEIAADVEASLRWDRFVDDGLIDVQVSDGVVALSGTVGSAAERERAAGRAWVSGVRNVETRGLQVAHWTRNDALRAGKYVDLTDAEIEEAVVDALVFDPRVFSANVTPEVESGIVTLRGTVASVSARQAAVETARNTVGVWRVKDHLQVRPAADVSDEELAQRVRQALRRDPYVERHEVTVTAWNDDVTLTGTVDSEFEKSQAALVAGSVTGVEEIHNYLTVPGRWTSPYHPYGYPHLYGYGTYGPSRPLATGDWEIAEDIRSELWWSPFVDSDEVTVSVEDGVATLTGTVSTWYERQAAAENAIEGGAVSVDNRLRVRYGPESESSSD